MSLNLFAAQDLNFFDNIISFFSEADREFYLLLGGAVLILIMIIVIITVIVRDSRDSKKNDKRKIGAEPDSPPIAQNQSEKLEASNIVNDDSIDADLAFETLAKEIEQEAAQNETEVVYATGSDPAEDDKNKISFDYTRKTDDRDLDVSYVNSEISSEPHTEYNDQPKAPERVAAQDQYKHLSSESIYRSRKEPAQDQDYSQDYNQNYNQNYKYNSYAKTDYKTEFIKLDYQEKEALEYKCNQKIKTCAISGTAEELQKLLNQAYLLKNNKLKANDYNELLDYLSA